MNKKVLILIIVFSSLSLMGVVVTQLYWVKKAITLKEDQFSTTVRLALKSVSTQMLNYYCSPEYLAANPDRTCSVKDFTPGYLRVLVREEFGCMKINIDYEYALVDTDNEELVMGVFNNYPDELLASEHMIPLTGFQNASQYALAAYFPRQQGLVMEQMVLWLVLSASFVIILILTLYFTIVFFLKQKKLSELKSDFVNNMTHEFKTPIATISLASEMLMNKQILEDPSKTARYAKVIFDENTRLQDQVEQVLKIALLDKGQIQVKKHEVDINKLIIKVINNFNMSVKKRQGSVKTLFYAEKHSLLADSEHIRNILSNLLDNAIKYSNGPPRVTITTRNNEKGITISVEDNGIGISHANQQEIFKKLYRVPTGDRHDVKGFGLGLYYVKFIVEAHGGSIKLESTPGSGSKFDVFLPFSNQNQN